MGELHVKKYAKGTQKITFASVPEHKTSVPVHKKTAVRRFCFVCYKKLFTISVTHR
jgi:hypothetical protein